MLVLSNVFEEKNLDLYIVQKLCSIVYCLNFFAITKLITSDRSRKEELYGISAMFARWLSCSLLFWSVPPTKWYGPSGSFSPQCHRPNQLGNKFRWTKRWVRTQIKGWSQLEEQRALPSFGEGSSLQFRRGASVLCNYSRLRIPPIVLFILLSKTTNPTSSPNIQIFFQTIPQSSNFLQ